MYVRELLVDAQRIPFIVVLYSVYIFIQCAITSNYKELKYRAYRPLGASIFTYRRINEQ